MNALELVGNVDVVRIRRFLSILEEFLVHFVELADSLVVSQLQESRKALCGLVSDEPLLNAHQLQTLVPLGSDHDPSAELECQT